MDENIFREELLKLSSKAIEDAKKIKNSKKGAFELMVDSTIAVTKSQIYNSLIEALDKSRGNVR